MGSKGFCNVKVEFFVRLAEGSLAKEWPLLT